MARTRSMMSMTVLALLAMLLLSSAPGRLARAEPAMEQASMQASMQALCQCADDGTASASTWAWALALAGPVCGSDGETYPSRCDLECAAAAPARLEAGLPPLSLHHEGPCSSSPTPTARAPQHGKPQGDIMSCAVQSAMCVPGCVQGRRNILDCIVQAVQKFLSCVLPRTAAKAPYHLPLPLTRARKLARSH